MTDSMLIEDDKNEETTFDCSILVVVSLAIAVAVSCIVGVKICVDGYLEKQRAIQTLLNESYAQNSRSQKYQNAFFGLYAFDAGLESIALLSGLLS